MFVSRPLLGFTRTRISSSDVTTLSASFSSLPSSSSSSSQGHLGPHGRTIPSHSSGASGDTSRERGKLQRKTRSAGVSPASRAVSTSLAAPKTPARRKSDSHSQVASRKRTPRRSVSNPAPAAAKEEHKADEKAKRPPLRRPVVVEEEDDGNDNEDDSSRAPNLSWSRDSAMESSYSVDQDETEARRSSQTPSRDNSVNDDDDDDDDDDDNDGDDAAHSVNLESFVDAFARMAVADEMEFDEGDDEDRREEPDVEGEDRDKDAGSAAPRPTTADALVGPSEPRPATADVAISAAVDAPAPRNAPLRREVGTDARPLPPPEVHVVERPAPRVETRHAAIDAMPLPPPEVHVVERRPPPRPTRDAATDAMPLPPAPAPPKLHVVERGPPPPSTRDAATDAMPLPPAGSPATRQPSPAAAPLRERAATDVMVRASVRPARRVDSPSPSLQSPSPVAQLPRSIFVDRLQSTPTAPAEPTPEVTAQRQGRTASFWEASADRTQRVLFASSAGSARSPVAATPPRRLQLRSSSLQIRSRSLRTTSTMDFARHEEKGEAGEPLQPQPQSQRVLRPIELGAAASRPMDSNAKVSSGHVKVEPLIVMLTAVQRASHHAFFPTTAALGEHADSEMRCLSQRCLLWRYDSLA